LASRQRGERKRMTSSEPPKLRELLFSPSLDDDIPQAEIAALTQELLHPLEQSTMQGPTSEVPLSSQLLGWLNQGPELPSSLRPSNQSEKTRPTPRQLLGLD